MPRKRQPPRLYFRDDEQVWIIRDGSKSVRTGCGASDSRGAEKALSAYLTEKFTPTLREHSPAKLTVAEVLTAYGREHAPMLTAMERAGYAISALMPYWGAKSLMEIKGATCREYAAIRGMKVKPGTIRRELAVLAAAIRFWHSEHGPLDSVPIVSRPKKPESKADWMTRSEAAQLLAACLGWYRLQWCDTVTRKVSTKWRRDLNLMNAAKRHLARFILIGLYTGTRSGAILNLHWMPNTEGGWVDLEQNVLYRRGSEVGQTKKRQPPSKLGGRLATHLRRWKAMDDAIRDKAAKDAGHPVSTHLHIVSWGGRGVKDIKTGWEVVIANSGLPDKFTPHTLRHTRATWMMQARVPIWEAAGSLGMTVKTLEDVYGHHHPDWQKTASEV